MSKSAQETEDKLRADAQKSYDKQEFALLSRIIGSAIKGFDEASLPEEKGRDFKRNMLRLAHFLSDDNDIPATDVTRVLIPLIQIIVLTEDEKKFDEVCKKIQLQIGEKQITVPFNNKQEDIRNCLVNLHKMCQDKTIKSLICKVQEEFSDVCIQNTGLPTNKRLQELQVWQYRSSIGGSKAEKAPSEIKRLHSEIEAIEEEVEGTKKFCASYKINL